MWHHASDEQGHKQREGGLLHLQHLQQRATYRELASEEGAVGKAVETSAVLQVIQVSTKVGVCRLLTCASKTRRATMIGMPFQALSLRACT